MVAAADHRPLTSKARYRPQIDPYVIVVEKWHWKCFSQTASGFNIHHSSITDAI